MFKVGGSQQQSGGGGGGVTVNAGWVATANSWPLCTTPCVPHKATVALVCVLVLRSSTTRACSMTHG
jgi:hypothetical protein